jgi:hypothetical protein
MPNPAMSVRVNFLLFVDDLLAQLLKTDYKTQVRKMIDNLLDFTVMEA